MSILEKVKQNWFIGIIIVASVSIGTTWKVSEELKVKPMEDRLKYLAASTDPESQIKLVEYHYKIRELENSIREKDIHLDNKNKFISNLQEEINKKNKQLIEKSDKFLNNMSAANEMCAENKLSEDQLNSLQMDNATLQEELRLANLSIQEYVETIDERELTIKILTNRVDYLKQSNQTDRKLLEMQKKLLELKN